MRIDRAFKKLADSLPFMMAYVDNERRYKHVNKAYEHFFGLPLSALKGKSVAEVVGEESYKEIAKLHTRVLAGEEVSFTDKVTLADGRNLRLEIKYVPNIEGRTQRVSGFFAIINDITEYASVAEVLRAVHDVVNKQSQVLSTNRINELLKLGCHYLNTDVGIVSQVDGNRYTVKFSYSEGADIAPGSTFNLGDTYCSVTLAADEVIATAHASTSKEYSGHPCYQAFQLETYLGLPIRINGKTWGTLNFSSPQMRLTPFTELDIELMGLICSAVETILINSSATNRLEKLAYTDFLTGLTNRLYFTERFDEIKSNSQEQDVTFFALIDIDHFKSINDTFGHDAGDRVLQETARKISSLVRNSDTVSRVGGEEFAIVLTHLSRQQAEQILEKIRTGVEKNKVQLEANPEFTVTVSIGATALCNKDQFNDVYKKSDTALYNSKRNGRNRVSWT